MKRLRSRLWETGSARQKALLVAVAVILGAAMYVWWIQSANQARSRLNASVPALKVQTARLEQHVAEYERLKNAPAITPSPTDLRTLLQAQADATGLSRALIRIDANNANQVQTVFGDLSFATWLAWIASSQSQRVRLDACRIEAAAQPGLVNVTATFVRPLSP